MSLKCSPWRRKYRHLYPTRYIHPRILRNIHPWRIAYDTSHLIRNINQLFWYFAIQPASLWRNWVTLMHASMSGVGNIVLFTAITHILVIYTLITGYIHTKNILMLVMNFTIHLDSTDLKINNSRVWRHVLWFKHFTCASSEAHANTCGKVMSRNWSPEQQHSYRSIYWELSVEILFSAIS